MGERVCGICTVAGRTYYSGLDKERGLKFTIKIVADVVIVKKRNQETGAVYLIKIPVDKVSEFHYKEFGDE